MTAIKVLFVIHFREVWTNLYDVLCLMRTHPAFAPLVVCVDHSMLGEPLGGSAGLSAMLEANGVPHLDLGGHANVSLHAFLDALQPDYVFRQTAFDNSVPIPFSTQELLRRNIAMLYIPYNLHIFDHPDITIHKTYIRASRFYFCFCEEHYRDYKSNAEGGGANAILTGNPKLDHIAITNSKQDAAEKPLTIIWAPHHSITSEWLGFGSFPRDYKAIIDFAQRRPDVRIIFRPHPLLFDVIKIHGVIPDEEVKQFAKEWDDLPNTERDTEADCAISFARSHAMISDGVSFLAEYQVTAKPLYFIQNAPTDSFTAVGKRLLRTATVVDCMDKALQAVDALAEAQSNETAQHPECADWLRPYPGQAARMIVETILADRNG